MGEMVRPYVRIRVEMLYTPDNPPPMEPPPELQMPNLGVWRVFAMQWHRHQPDETGRRCRECGRWYPCDQVIGADGGFRTAYRQAWERQRRARGVAQVHYPEVRNI